MSGPGGPGPGPGPGPGEPRAGVPACYDEVCITCSDQAIPVRILQVLADDIALVDTGQSEEHVSIALVTAGVGDTVLVHAKEAIAVVPGA